MNTNAFHKKTVADNSGSDSFDPALREQIETSLNGAYRFNADAAKLGVIWVWLVKTPAIGSGVAALGSMLIGFYLLVTSSNVQLFKTHETRPSFLIDIRSDEWILYIGAAIGLGMLCAFFSYMTSAMKRSHHTAMRMAKEYNATSETN